jgi:hypothetical protein
MQGNFVEQGALAAPSPKISQSQHANSHPRLDAVDLVYRCQGPLSAPSR